MFIIIGGPTASGKSRLAIEVAKKLDGEIISADSMQIYKGFDIGTAKITVDEMQNITHYGIDIVDGNQKFSVAEYKDYTLKIIKDIQNKGKIPIVVGGTGLYLRALINPFDFGGTSAHEDFRQECRNIVEKFGNNALYKKLQDIAPDVAKNIHENNLVRVIRALEIAYFGENTNKTNENVEKIDVLYFILDCNRNNLYEKINKRVDEMISMGLEDEVRRLYEKIPTVSQSFLGIGYKEWIPYFKNEIDIKKVIDDIKINSRHYAKRQVTWFSKENGIVLDGSQSIDENVEKIVEIYKNRSNQ